MWYVYGLRLRSILLKLSTEPTHQKHSLGKHQPHNNKMDTSENGTLAPKIEFQRSCAAVALPEIVRLARASSLSGMSGGCFSIVLISLSVITVAF